MYNLRYFYIFFLCGWGWVCVCTLTLYQSRQHPIWSVSTSKWFQKRFLNCPVCRTLNGSQRTKRVLGEIINNPFRIKTVLWSFWKKHVIFCLFVCFSIFKNLLLERSIYKDSLEPFQLFLSSDCSIWSNSTKSIKSQIGIKRKIAVRQTLYSRSCILTFWTNRQVPWSED